MARINYALDKTHSFEHKGEVFTFVAEKLGTFVFESETKQLLLSTARFKKMLQNNEISNMKLK